MTGNRYQIVLKDVGADVCSFDIDGILSIIKTMQQIQKLLDEKPVNCLAKAAIYDKIKELEDVNFYFVEDSLLESMSDVAPQEYIDNNPRVISFSVCEENGRWVKYTKTKID